MQQQVTIPQAIQYAVQFIQAARIGEARNILEQVIRQEPNHHEALHLMAYIANASGDITAAEQFLRRAIALNPGSAVYRQNLGALLYNRGQNESAEIEFRAAMQLDPKYAEPVMKIGVMLESKGQFDQAEQYYRQAIAMQPDYAEAYCNLGDVLIKKGLYAESLVPYEQAIRINPNLSEAYANRAMAMDKIGREQEAYENLVRAVQINPNMPPALASLGQVLSRRGDYAQSVALLTRAIELQPTNFNFQSALAISHLRAGEAEKAVEHCKKSIALNPKFVDPWANLGLSLMDLGRHQEALDAYSEALKLDPDCSGTRANRALIYLRLGDFERGFLDYDHRWQLPEFKQVMRDYKSPRWEGQEVAGKTLLLWHEQGFGDTIHLIRYAKLLAGRDATVIAQVQPQLLSLMKSVAGVSRLITREDPVPPADFHAPLLSLPGLMRTRMDSVPGEVPYISADPALITAWRDRVQSALGAGASDKPLRVGITWFGNPHLRLDHARSIPLSRYAPLSRIPGVRLFSLQVGTPPSPAAGSIDLIDLTGHIRDFSDTAALLAHLDLVISVDTAVLHLAGAMALPAWALIPKWPDWRWQLDREDTPWYPTMRLFRQPVAKDWDSVFAKIATELAAETRKPR